MQTPELPDNEVERNNALDELGLIYTPAEARFDRITRLVKRHFGVDAALVSLVYKDMQWFKSVQGLNACSTSRDVSFCGHVILQDLMFEIPDALEDPRFCDNPLVIGGPKVRFYAGVPLKDKQGLNLGTLCMFSSTPRQLDHEEQRDLFEFAALAELELERGAISAVVEQLVFETPEARRAMMIDPILGSWNRLGFKELALRECQAALMGDYGLGILNVKILNFDELQTRFGIQRGVDVSRYVASVCREQMNPQASVGSLGQDHLILLAPRLDNRGVGQLLERLNRAFAGGTLVSQSVEIQPQVVASGVFCSAEALQSRSVSQFVDSLLQ
jgi:GGDEF domain-containing protein